MKIKVIGKAHLRGTSKRTGNAYDFVQVHYNGPARGVEGEAAKTLMLDPLYFPLSSIVIGATYNVDFDDRGYVVDFVPASGK
ncbi:hypothetical protein [Dysosmobacter sp.]|uniref:hypothetical protein n=1 Tax=Dysosmobacter sp. TaxID=2591382 RepID=UPI002A8F1A40|nr:hypothetical protein [Dysosmobacter sp.]MDY3281296.1 hypothetical protein [Dysosmobacter sp.]